jgi:hypothetical protein
VLLDAAGVGNGVTALATSIGFARRPRLGKTCGAPGGGTEEWPLVYRQEYYQQATGALRVTFVSRSGQQRFVAGYGFTDLTVATPNLGSDWDVSSPTDHGPDGRWMLAVERRYDAGTGNAVILSLLFDRAVFLPVGLQVVRAGSHDKRGPVVDSDGVRFAVAYGEVFSAYDTDVHVHTLRWHAGYLVEDDFCRATIGFEPERGPALCASAGARGVYGLAWVHEAASFDVLEAQLYGGIAAGGFAQRATGCGGLAIAATGVPALGTTVVVSLPNAPGLAGFVAGAAVTLPIAACPGCLQGATGATVLGTSLPIAIPADPGFVGLQFAVQGFRFAPGGQPCLGQLALSASLDLTVQ